VNLVDVDKDIQLTGGTGTADLSVVTQQVSQTIVSEPAALAILAVSLLGMGAACRRFS
jgi:hypothetical protein